MFNMAPIDIVLPHFLPGSVDQNYEVHRHSNNSPLANVFDLVAKLAGK